MTERRRFSWSEKNAMFAAWKGRCARCSTLLDEGWHADHVMPYSKGGKTELLNGQPLCPICNLKKGNRVGYQDLFDPNQRSFQLKAINAVVNDWIARTLLTVCLVWPGSGKTLVYEAAATELFRQPPVKGRKSIRYVVVFVPRRCLAEQAEIKWRHRVLDKKGNAVKDPFTGLPVPDDGDYRLFDPRCRLERLRHRENRSPLIEPRDEKNGLVGYATTYQSLVSDGKKEAHLGGQLHLTWAQEHEGEFLLVADEAQFLGSQDGDEDMDAPLSGKYFEELARYAGHVLLLTGSPDRADGRKLVMCDDLYTEDDRGRLHLDKTKVVYAGYSDGIAENYLRTFHVEYHEIHVKVKDSDIEYDLAMAHKQDPQERVALAEVLRYPYVWQPMVDKTVNNLKLLQAISPNRKGKALIGCLDQNQAREVMDYLRERHHDLVAKIAISDQDTEEHGDAKKNLRSRDWDILVSVRMAFIGFDCPEISVVCVLTNYRDLGHLVQLIFRGGRVLTDGGPNQLLRIICPDDRSMVKFIEYLRSEQDLGIKQSGDGSSQLPLPGDRPQLEHAVVTGVHSASMDPSMSMDAETYAIFQAALVAAGDGGAIQTAEQLRRAIQGLGTFAKPSIATPAPAAAPRTDRESTERYKGEAADIINKWMAARGYNHKADPAEYGRTRAILTKRIQGDFEGGISGTDDITTSERAEAYRDHVITYLAREDRSA